MKNTILRISHRLGLAPSIGLPPFGSSASRAGTVRSLKLSVLGRRRSVPHLERKFYHMLMGSICFALYAFCLDRTQALLALGTIGGTFVILDLIRLRFPRANALTLRLFGKIMRREELKSVSGNSFFVLGLLVITFLFPKPVVLLSVLFLALGDPIAAIVGTLYGRHRLVAGKSLEGAAANLAVCGLASFMLALLYFHWSLDRALVMGLIGGVVSTVSELAPLPLDDNFTIPVLSALQLAVLSLVLML